MLTLVICDEGMAATMQISASSKDGAVIEKLGDEDGFKILKNSVCTPLFDEYLERHRTWQEASRKMILTGEISHVCFVGKDFNILKPNLIAVKELNMSLKDPMKDWEIRNRGVLLSEKIGVV